MLRESFFLFCQKKKNSPFFLTIFGVHERPPRGAADEEASAEHRAGRTSLHGSPWGRAREGGVRVRGRAREEGRARDGAEPPLRRTSWIICGPRP